MRAECRIITNELVAHTPPGTSSGQAEAFGSYAAPVRGNMQTISGPSKMGQVAEEDEDAAPAPVIMKSTAKSTKSTKSGVKRRSLFGIPIGKKEPVVAAH